MNYSFSSSLIRAYTFMDVPKKTADVFDTAISIDVRIPQLEEIIATHAVTSYYYSINKLKDCFILGEQIIATDPKYSYWYARNVIKGPFELCHPVIFNSDWKSNYIDYLKSINYDFKEIYESYGEWFI